MTDYTNYETRFGDDYYDGDIILEKLQKYLEKDFKDYLSQQYFIHNTALDDLTIELKNLTGELTLYSKRNNWVCPVGSCFDYFDRFDDSEFNHYAFFVPPPVCGAYKLYYRGFLFELYKIYNGYYQVEYKEEMREVSRELFACFHRLICGDEKRKQIPNFCSYCGAALNKETHNCDYCGALYVLE